MAEDTCFAAWQLVKAPTAQGRVIQRAVLHPTAGVSAMDVPAFLNIAGVRYRLRSLAAGDLDIVVRHRHRMFVDSGWADDEVMAERTAAFRNWLAPRLEDGRYFGWLIEQGDTVAAGLGMMIIDWPPHPLHGEPWRGYILNVYTEPAHRRRGLARRLTDCALDEARRRGIRLVFLHATEEGRFVYEQAGFMAKNEMQRVLPEERELRRG